MSNRTRNSVVRFDGETGEYIGAFVSGDADLNGGLVSPQEVRYAHDGHLLVDGFENTEVFKYDGETGEFLGAFTSGYALQNPTKMTFGPDGHLYVSQWGGSDGLNKVVRFDGETGILIDEFTSVEIARAMGHAWDEEGVLYVASYDDGDVKRFAPDGSFIDVFTSRAVRNPVNAWFGTGGDLFVQSWGEGKVERFDGQTGEYLGTFSSNLVRTEGYGFYGDMLYLCDWQSNIIKRYDAETGEDIDTFIDHRILRNPNSLLFMPVSVSNEPSLLPSSVTLWQSHPNPTSDAATIRFSLDTDAVVSLRVYDLLGRAVATVADGFRPAGDHTATFDRGPLPAGLYFVRLEANGRVLSRRLTLTR